MVFEESDGHYVWRSQDMGELEEAVAANLWPLGSLGNPLRVFQGFKRLLSLETSDLKDSPLLGELPPLIVTHHLFSRAPSVLQSPHTRAGFTPQQVALPFLEHLSQSSKAYYNAMQYSVKPCCQVHWV
jgi:hypothetical protein